jgi:hypothetical protein
MAELLCLNQRDGVGVPCENITPLTVLRSIFLTRPGFSFDDSADFADKDIWDAAIAAKDILPLQNIKGFENQKVEDGLHTTDTGDKIFLWDGMRGGQLKFVLTLDQHKILKRYSDQNYLMFKGDRGNNIAGVLNDDGTISGVELSYFHVKDQTEATATEPPFTPVEYQEVDPGEYNVKGCYVNPTWRIKNLTPVTKIVITSSTVATFIFTVTAAYVPASKFTPAGAAVSIPCTGLLEDNFKVIDQGGDSEPVTVVESTVTPGTYVVTGTNITSGTCQIVATGPVAGPPVVPAILFESAEITLTAAV